MKTCVARGAMLVVLLGLATLSAIGQNPAGAPAGTPAADSKTNAPPMALDRIELGVTFTYKVAQVASAPGSRFVMPGGSLDGAYYFGGILRNLGVAFDLNGESASAIEPGINLSQITFVGGPRYRWLLDKNNPHKAIFYSEVLVGGVHAFNSVFPASGGATSSASSFALQAGGGFNLQFTRNLGLRLIEVDYVMTDLPNNANSYQGDLRISNGLTFHF